MSAPNGTIWGSIVGSGTGQGRIGIYVTSSSTATQTTVTMQIWFWTKYSVYGSINTFHYSFTGTGVIDIGSRNIQHPSNSGGWSTENQTHIGTYTKTYNRSTSPQTIECAADFSGIATISGSGWVVVNYTIPALNKYTITYNGNGGLWGSSPSWSEQVYYGTNYTTQSNFFTRQGYTFLGWKESNGTDWTQWIGKPWSWTYERNVTLYAQWKINQYNLTFDAGTNGGLVNGASHFAKVLKYGDALGELPVATKKNYKFLGWNTRVDGTGQYIQSSYIVTTNVTFYAVFKLQANARVKKDGNYKTVMLFKKENGVYKSGASKFKKSGVYKETKIE